MSTPKMTSLALLALVAFAGGCVADGRHGHARARSNQPEAVWGWGTVHRDPCRYDEYQRFAQAHSDPDKRSRFVERLARDGCSRDREDRSDPLDYHYPRG